MMILTILLIIYLLGVISVLVLEYFAEKRHATEYYSPEVTVKDLMIALGFSLFSWCGFIAILTAEFGDTVIFKFKK